MLWENKHKNAIDKVIDKNPSNAYIELKMSYYKQMIQEFDEMPKERNAYFICEQFGTVLEQFKDKAKSWLDRYGNVLKELGMKGLKQIKADIDVCKDKLK